MTTVPKTRTVLSLESVLEESVAGLDEIGAEKMSLRALAKRLGAGVSSIYWYVDSKNQLLDMSVDRVLADVVATVDPDSDPFDAIRDIAVRLFETIDEHQWCAGRITQDPVRQLNSVRILDLVGRQLSRVGLPVDDQFHSATAILGFVIGLGTQMVGAQNLAGDAVTRLAYLDAAANRWKDVDPDELPFVHTASAVLREHDDAEQFSFGLDLLLDGIRQRQARRL
nr:TetR/AcrR family transcriptional regulator C-terminal domain-containing protein [Rhodococcus sp. (in: high G+C Gram-positive bacteria)]